MAREYSFTIFEDDPYIALRFRGETLPTMLSLDGGAGNVVYASSFSKTVCPGIRVGFLVGPAELIKPDRRARDEHLHLPEHGRRSDRPRVLRAPARSTVRSRRSATLWRQRVAALGEALTAQIPGASFVPPDGGYFLWVTLPEGAEPAAVLRASAERGLALVNGDDFVLDGGSGAVRLAFSGVTVDEIREGVGRLADAVNSSLRG